MTLRSCLPLAFAFVAVFAHAAEKPEDAAARSALKGIVPDSKITAIEAAPLPGYRQVLLGSQIVYVSDDGQYMLSGTLYDVDAKRDLTASRLAVDHKKKVDAVPAAKRIVFAPDKPKYKITVFTDIDCGYCRKLHSQIAEYNKRGIEVDYLFFPRSGLNTPSFDKAVSVWCAKDRKSAFTEAKAGKTPAAAKCDNPVAEEYKLGAQVGVDGTPTIFAADGTKIGGYLSPNEMLAKLQTLGTATLAGN
ncbi:MAG TPA: thioredoxin fold domain-containing protein [Rhodanobacteraceae bacterium]|nr:thioredoxin fold domain-containing protein [Rhodanobacteraceae bacterium]